MANRKPIVVANGESEQLQSADNLDMSGSEIVNGSAIFQQYTIKTVTNTTVETTLTNTGRGSLTLPANFFYAQGVTLRIIVRGVLTKTSSSGLTIRIKLGGTTYILANFTSGDIANFTNGSFVISAMITCYTTGATGTVFTQGDCFAIAPSGSSGTVRTSGTTFFVKTTAQTLDTTIAQTVDITAQWSAAATTLVMTCTNLNIYQSK